MKKTDQLSDTVFWPKPIAEDNSLFVEVASTHKEDEMFGVGVTMVNYTAVDKSGNKAVCSFSVTITLGELNLRRAKSAVQY